MFLKETNETTDGKSYINKLLDIVEDICQNLDNNIEDSTCDIFSKNQQDSNISDFNSLGMSMEGNLGINLAIIKGNNQKKKIEKEDIYQSSNALLNKNYKNLEKIIRKLIKERNTENFLKILNLNRLKVLIELSIKTVGRKYTEISDEERNILEIHANRYQVLKNFH